MTCGMQNRRENTEIETTRRINWDYFTRAITFLCDQNKNKNINGIFIAHIYRARQRRDILQYDT